MWGVYPDAIDCDMAQHTQILILASMSEVGSQSRNGANFIGFKTLKVFFFNPIFHMESPWCQVSATEKQKAIYCHSSNCYLHFVQADLIVWQKIRQIGGESKKTLVLQNPWNRLLVSLVSGVR